MSGRSPNGLPPAAHEVLVGNVQPSHGTHPHQYGAGHEAEAPARVRPGARDGAPDRAESRAAFCETDERALSLMARSASGTQRIGSRINLTRQPRYARCLLFAFSRSPSFRWSLHFAGET